MQRSLPVLIALVLLFLTAGYNLNQKADYQKGLEGYEKSNYETALREFEPLMDQPLCKSVDSLTISVQARDLYAKEWRLY